LYRKNSGKQWSVQREMAVWTSSSLYGKTSGKEWSVCRELTIDGVESRPKVAWTKKNSGKQWSVQREMAVWT
jgi:hypothetical protein